MPIKYLHRQPTWRKPSRPDTRFEGRDRQLVAAALGVVALAWSVSLTATALAVATCTAATATAAGLQAPQWPVHPNWQQYVTAPTTRDVRPTGVVRMSGEVAGAQNLVDPALGGVATLTMVTGGALPTIVLDYGKDVGGVPYFVVRSESGLPVLRASYAEGLQYVGVDGDDGGSKSPAGDPSRADDLAVTAPGTLSTGLIQGGERYELITLTSPGSVTLSAVGIRFSAVRATASDYRGWFDSSSAQLNHIWYDGAYTVQLDELPADTLPALAPTSGSLDPLPLIMDGARRDRVVWSGDLAVEGPVVFCTTAADRYVRASLRLLGSYQNADGECASRVLPTAPLGAFPETGCTYSTSYSMDAVDDIATYYLYTGDLAFVRSEWPMITRELAYNASLTDSRGLLATDASDGKDWDYFDGAKSGEVTVFNVIYDKVLRDAARLASALGHRADAATYRHRAAALTVAINSYLVDPTTGLYQVSSSQPGTIAQDANVLAVLYGVTPKAQVPSVLSALRKALWTTPYGPVAFSTDTGYQQCISPFVSHYEVAARMASGKTASAFALLRMLWGHMDAPGPDDSSADWEMVAPDGAPGKGAPTHLAHGWASGATADLSAYVLGVQPVRAGYRTWLVQPHPGSLSWAEGNVPTLRGTIAVRWTQDHRSGRFVLEVSAPAGSRGTISVPVPRRGSVVVVRARGYGGSSVHRRSIKTARGTTYLAVHARGDATYRVDVQPR